MKYLRKFNTEADYAAAKNRSEIVYPNVILIDEFGNIEFNNPKPFYIEALEDGVVTMTKRANSVTLFYSYNNKDWISYTDAVNIKKGRKVYFYGTFSTSGQGSSMGTFTSTGKYNVGGNVLSLARGLKYLRPTSTPLSSNQSFSYLFYESTTLVSAEDLELPAYITSSCYASTFLGCTSLEKAPTLPATKLASNCYLRMFQNCTSLKKAPTLPATQLHTSCYSSMFKDCTSLKKAPTLPATKLASNCYLDMFNGCTSLEEAPMLPATTLASSCYGYMFQNCTSLKEAPTLPATRLASSCYGNMFNGCTSLTYIRIMTRETTSATSGCTNWVNNVASSGIFVQDEYVTFSVGVSGIPSGWTKKYAITFKVNSIQYIANKNATWVDWIATTDNTDGYKVSGTNVLSADGVKVMLDGVAVVATDVIASQGVYTLEVTETASEA